jgi:hypothetical protein
MKFKVKELGKEFPIKLTYGMAIRDLPEKFGLQPLRLFSDQMVAQEMMTTLVLNDEKALSLMWYFVQPNVSITFDDFLDKVSPDELNSFVEVFWEALSNFSGPLKRPIMLTLWEDFKKSLRDPESMKEKSTESASELSPGE